MNELLGLLKGVAPALATAVAGPLGGTVISAIAGKLGVADEVNAVAQAIAGDPAAGLRQGSLQDPGCPLPADGQASSGHSPCEKSVRG